MKCDQCGNEYSASCDYKQGRCPHHPSMLDQILADPYKSRFYNLLNSIKNFFTKSDCDCGHKH
jgi:hypothetical protein